MKKVINRGFTLIELLVVIAIIGILASIVLVSLNSARSKGKDTRVISDVKQIQTQIESEAAAGGSYQVGASYCITGLGASNAATVSSSGNCASLNSDAANNNAGAVATGVYVKTNGASGATSFTQYAVRGYLASGNNGYFCVDSTGQATTSSNGTAPTGYTCP